MGSREEDGVVYFPIRNRESLKLCAESMTEVVQIIGSSLDDISTGVTAALMFK